MEMQVTETARHLPAACAVCMGHMGPFADTQVDLGAVEDQNGFGWLYVCHKCVGTMAALFGYITPEAADALHAEIETSKQYAALTEDLLKEANQSKVVSLSELQEAGLVVPAAAPGIAAPVVTQSSWQYPPDDGEAA